MPGSEGETGPACGAGRAAGCLTSVGAVCTGKVKKELDADDGHLNLDETAKLLQDLHEAQAERGGSRPPSNLSSLSNTSPSDRDQHHLGKAAPGPSIWRHLGKGRPPAILALKS